MSDTYSCNITDTPSSAMICVLACLLSSARADSDDKYGSTQNLDADPISAAVRAARSAVPEKVRPAPDKSAYPPPTDWIYNTSAAVVPGKLNVHVVPHSHDDTGWLVTVDQYFDQSVSYMFDTVSQSLADDPHRTFIEVETGFFARWWKVQTPKKRAQVRAQIAAGSIEFINGGWCMHDEAAPLFVSMVDQTTRGHQFLRRHFNVTPTATWQIDPFGHSNTQAWLLGHQAGFDSMFFARVSLLPFF